MTFAFNDIKNHALLNKLAIDEAERNYLSASNTNKDSYISKLYNSLQGKGAELYLVENKGMKFLDNSTINLLEGHKYYTALVHNVLYHDLVFNNKIIEVKAFSEDGIDYKIENSIARIKTRTWNFSDVMLVFMVKDWNYTLYKKIDLKD